MKVFVFQNKIIRKFLLMQEEMSYFLCNNGTSAVPHRQTVLGL